jgi:hypothetical protein
VQKNSTSGIKGVRFIEKRNVWEAYTNPVGGKRYKRWFKTKEEAVAAITAVRKEIYGEFACD